MGHGHLIYGDTKCPITGQTLPDTDDERARQKIAKILLEEKKIPKKRIIPRKYIAVDCDGKTGRILIDFLVYGKNYPVMAVRYAPGSLVTRHRPAVAAARIIEPGTVRRVVVTNGIEADILDVENGRIIASGIDHIPSFSEIEEIEKTASMNAYSKEQIQKAKRILYAMDILTEKECEEYTCKTC